MFYTGKQRDTASEGDSPLTTKGHHPKEAVGSLAPMEAVEPVFCPLVRASLC